MSLSSVSVIGTHFVFAWLAFKNVRAREIHPFAAPLRPVVAVIS